MSPPLYPFEDDQGQVVERFFRMADAPEIGAVVTDPDHLEATIRRLPSGCTRAVVAEYRHVAHSLPRVHDPRKVAELRRREASKEKDPIRKEELLKSADEWSRAEKFWPHTTRSGKPIFTSRAQVQEYAARCERRVGWSQD